MKHSPFLFGLVVGIFLTGGVLFFPDFSSSVSQPIDYSHKVHIESAGLSCPDCHVSVETGVHATIPNIGVCVDCHEEAIGDSPEEKKVVEAIAADTPIPWIQIHVLRDDLFFSHRRHVQVAGLDCAHCHGEVAEKDHPFTRPAVSLTMGFCLDCHYEHGMPRNCSECHR